MKNFGARDRQPEERHTPGAPTWNVTIATIDLSLIPVPPGVCVCVYGRGTMCCLLPYNTQEGRKRLEMAKKREKNCDVRKFPEKLADFFIGISALP